MGNEMSSHKKKGRKGKVHNGDLNGHAVNVSSNDLTEAVTTEVTVEQTSQSSALAAKTDANPSPALEDTSVGQANGEVQEQSNKISSDKAAAEQINDAVCNTLEGEESSGETKNNFFDKLFKKKNDTKPVEDSADQVDAEEEASNLQAAAKEHSSKTGNFEVIEIMSPVPLTTSVNNECESLDSISDFEVIPMTEGEHPDHNCHEKENSEFIPALAKPLTSDERQVTEHNSPKPEELHAEDDVGQVDVQSEFQPEVTIEPDLLLKAVDVAPEEKTQSNAVDTVDEEETEHASVQAQKQDLSHPKTDFEFDSTVNEAEKTSEEISHNELCAEVGNTRQTEMQPEYAMEGDVSDELDLGPQKEAEEDVKILLSEGTQDTTEKTLAQDNAEDIPTQENSEDMSVQDPPKEMQDEAGYSPTLDNTAKESLVQDVSEDTVPQDNTEDTLPQNNTEEISSQDATEETLPQDNSEDTLPQVNTEDISAQYANEDTLAEGDSPSQDINDSISAQDANENTLVQDNSEDTLPQDNTEDISAQDASIEILAQGDSPSQDNTENISSQGTTQETLAQGNSEDTLPQDNTDGITAQDATEETLAQGDSPAQDINDSISAQDANENTLAQDNSEDILPQDNTEDISAQDASIEILAQGDSPSQDNTENISSQGTTQETLAQGNSEDTLPQDNTDGITAQDATEETLAQGDSPAQDINDSISAQDANENTLTQDNSEDTLPQDNTVGITAQDATEETLAEGDSPSQDINDNVLAQDANENNSAQDSSEDTLPQDNTEDILARDAAKDTPAQGDFPLQDKIEDVSAEDTTKETLAQGDSSSQDNAEDFSAQDTTQETLSPENSEDTLPQVNTEDISAQYATEDTLSEGDSPSQAINIDIIAQDTYKKTLAQPNSEDTLAQDNTEDITALDATEETLAQGDSPSQDFNGDISAQDANDNNIAEDDSEDTLPEDNTEDTPAQSEFPFQDNTEDILAQNTSKETLAQGSLSEDNADDISAQDATQETLALNSAEDTLPHENIEDISAQYATEETLAQGDSPYKDINDDIKAQNANEKTLAQDNSEDNLSQDSTEDISAQDAIEETLTQGNSLSQDNTGDISAEKISTEDIFTEENLAQDDSEVPLSEDNTENAAPQDSAIDISDQDNIDDTSALQEPDLSLASAVKPEVSEVDHTTTDGASIGGNEEELHAEDPSEVTEVQSECQPEVIVEQDIAQETAAQKEAKTDADMNCSENADLQDTLDGSSQETQEELIEKKIDDDSEKVLPSEQPVVSKDCYTVVIKEMTKKVMGNTEDTLESPNLLVEGSHTSEETIGEQIDTVAQAGVGVAKIELIVPKELDLMDHSPSTVGGLSKDGGAAVIKDIEEEKPSPTGLSTEESTQLLIKLQTACIKILEELSLFSVQSINVKIAARQSTIQLMIDFCLCTNDVAKCGNDTSKSSKQNDESQKRDEEGQIPVPQSNSVEPVDIKDSTELEQSEGESLHSSQAAIEQDQSEENPVMNFFKTLVTPTKTPKEATASSDVSKDQSQKDTAATAAPANTQEVDAKGKMAPSPPSEPLKMEGKAEPTVKKEESQDAPKETEAGVKPKAAKESPFSKLFRSKTVEETAEPVEVETDASKAATLEASAKAEPAPPAKEEEKKPEEKKSSHFASLFKPKVLLDQVTSKIQAVASTSGIRRAAKTAGPAAEPPKDTPAVAASPEPAQAAKAKEEVKAAPPSAPPAPPAPPVDKPVESAENSSPTVPRKEKRNSIQLFFKNLGQKRHSDAGVQAEAAAASPAEKGK